jgi:hypothetical protein
MTHRFFAVWAVPLSYGKGYRFSRNRTGVKNGVRMCITYQCEFVVSENNGPNNPNGTPPTLISCIGTSWISVGNLLIVRGHASCEMKPSITNKQHKCGIYHIPHEGTISQNSLVLHDLRCRVFGSQFPSIDISATLCSISCWWYRHDRFLWRWIQFFLLEMYRI